MAFARKVLPVKPKRCCVKLLSPAKLNLYLNILGKYSNGYHQLESVVERISLADWLSISLLNDSKIEMLANDLSLANENNLCYKAAKLLQKQLKIPYGFRIHLTKLVPYGAGLGSASSNAAHTIIGIDQLLKLKLSLKEKYQLGGQLGSDVNFFLSQASFARVGGRGEKIKPFNAKPLKHLIVWPGVKLSTALVYANFRSKLTKFLNNVNILQLALKRSDLVLVRHSLYNALEQPAERLCKDIEKVKDYFARQQIFLRVTGSGSALFAVLDKNQRFDLKKMPKNWQTFTATTF